MLIIGVPAQETRPMLVILVIPLRKEEDILSHGVDEVETAFYPFADRNRFLYFVALFEVRLRLARIYGHSGEVVCLLNLQVLHVAYKGGIDIECLDRAMLVANQEQELRVLTPASACIIPPPESFVKKLHLWQWDRERTVCLLFQPFDVILHRYYARAVHHQLGKLNFGHLLELLGREDLLPVLARVRECLVLQVDLLRVVRVFDHEG